VGGTVAMVVLPRYWFPVLAEPAVSLLTGLVLSAQIFLECAYFKRLTRVLQESPQEVERIREESMQQAVERARELEQMSAQLSHELKNPLGAIKTFVQLSCRHATDPDSREQLQLAEGEVERMNTILQGYLSFSRPLDKLRPQPVEVESLADEVLQLLDARARAAGVTLRRRGQARLEADPRRLREALFT